MRSSVPATCVFLTAALLEVAGDAVMRRGLRSGGFLVILSPDHRQSRWLGGGWPLKGA